MTLMIDQVLYQLEKAEFALREARKFLAVSTPVKYDPDMDLLAPYTYYDIKVTDGL